MSAGLGTEDSLGLLFALIQTESNLKYAADETAGIDEKSEKK